MSAIYALLAAVAAAGPPPPPPASPGTGAAVAVRASARVLPAATVRQGQAPEAQQPAARLTRKGNGEVLLEYT